MRDRIPCRGECCGRSEHDLVGENPVRRLVWRCNDCGTKRAGPGHATNIPGDRQPVATDGGEQS